MALILERRDFSQIERGSRSWRVAIELRAVDGSNTYWCDINKPHPTGNIDLGGGEGEPDPGVARLIGMPSLSLRRERGTGEWATQPINLSFRNEDSWFDRTKEVFVLDENAVQRSLPAIKRSWVRIRFIDLSANPEDDGSHVVDVFYIDKISTAGGRATVALQPLLNLLQKVSPAAVKQGDRWPQNQEAADLVRRLVAHAIPGVEFNESRMPKRITVPVRQEALVEAGSNYVHIGPGIDNLGRQPEKLGGVLTYDAGQITTAMCKDVDDPGILWYGTTNASGQVGLYKLELSTGDSTEIWSFALQDFPIAGIQDIGGGVLLFTQLANNRDNDFPRPWARALYTRTIEKDGSNLNTRTPAVGRWAFCDTLIPYTQDIGTGSWGVGRGGGSGGSSDYDQGEPIFIGFPQFAAAVLNTWAYHNLRQSYEELLPRRVFRDSGDDTSRLSDALRFYEHSGWTSSFTSGQDFNGAAAHFHLQPFPFPIQYVPGKDRIYELSWGGSSVIDNDEWKIHSHVVATDTDETTREISFPTLSPNQKFRQYQPTGWCVVSTSGDPNLGTVNWLIIATMKFRNDTQDARSAYQAQLWKVDLDITPDPNYTTGNGGLTLLWESSANTLATNTLFPTLLDFAFVPSGPGAFQFPMLVGCYADRRSGTYRLWHFNLDNDFMDLELGNIGAPVSAAPLVGFQAYDGSIPSNAETRRAFFRDCATGALWEDSIAACNMMGLGAPVDTTSSWESVPKLAVIENADPKLATVAGACAPSSPLWSMPSDGNGVPRIQVSGSFHPWRLAPEVTVRVPVADMSPSLAKWVKTVLDFIAQAGGPDWTYDFDEDAKFYFEQTSSGLSSYGLIDKTSRNYRASWFDRELSVHNVKRMDANGEDVQNQIIAHPWEAVFPAVSGQLEYVSRFSGVTPEISISAHSNTDSARRVMLNVVKDGVVGAIGSGTGLDSDWETSLLLSVAEWAEDILTEISVSAASYNTLRVRGMTPGAPTDPTVRRLIHGVEVVAAHSNYPGDFIQIGDSAVGRVVGFQDPDTVLTSGLGSSTVAAAPGTTVRIQPGRSRNLAQGGDAYGFLQVDAFADAVATEVDCLNASIVHPGNVIDVDGEFMRVTNKRAKDNPVFPWTHTLTVERGYLDTVAQAHAGGPFSATVFLHPTSSLPQPVGATGLTLEMSADADAAPKDRTLQSGDRIILEFEGVKAARSKYDTSAAEDPESQETYGKRSWKLDDNPYLSLEVAPHMAWLWLQRMKSPRTPFSVTLPFCPELPRSRHFYLYSEARLPDEVGNTINVRIRGLSHDAGKATHLQLISTVAAATGPRTGDQGAGVGGAVGAPGGA